MKSAASNREPTARSDPGPVIPGGPPAANSTVPSMQCLGLLGCDRSLLCTDYERHILREVAERYAGQVTPHFVSLTMHVPALVAAHQSTDRQELEHLVAAGVSALARLGAEAVVICTSVLQPVVERMPSLQPGSLMADTVVPVVSLPGRRRVAVIGAVDDQEERYWRRRFIEFGRAEALFPVAADRAHMARLIAEEFSRGVINETSRSDVRRIVYGLRQAGARAFVLLSPALDPVLPQADFVLPIFDATELHALAAVDWALGARSGIPLLRGLYSIQAPERGPVSVMAR